MCVTRTHLKEKPFGDFSEECASSNFQIKPPPPHFYTTEEIKGLYWQLGVHYKLFGRFLFLFTE